MFKRRKSHNKIEMNFIPLRNYIAPGEKCITDINQLYYRREHDCTIILTLSNKLFLLKTIMKNQ